MRGEGQDERGEERDREKMKGIARHKTKKETKKRTRCKKKEICNKKIIIIKINQHTPPKKIRDYPETQTISQEEFAFS